MKGKKSDIDSELYNNELKSRLLQYKNIDENGCWNWLKCKRYGYGVIRAKRRNYLAHRLSYELLKGINPGEKYLCHKCDNPSCINPDHLFLGDQQQNMTDAVKKNRMKQAEDHYNCKLSKKQVLQIREFLKLGYSHRKLAKLFDVSYSCISSISLRKTWKSLKE